MLVGPSGAGKTTLLNLLHFLDKPSSGQLNFKGQLVPWPMPIHYLREIGMVFQRPEFLNTDVLRNITYPLQLRKLRNDDLVEEIMEKLDLISLSKSTVRTLSGGELQRVALARVLVTRPKVLLLDEPTANLDPYHVELIEGIIRDFHQSGSTIIMVTHNILQAKRLASKVGLMLGGGLVEMADVEKFFTSADDPRVISFLRGEIIY